MLSLGDLSDEGIVASRTDARDSNAGLELRNVLMRAATDRRGTPDIRPCCRWPQHCW
jgi:hypothetical protein